MPIIQPIDRDGRCDAQPTPSPLAKLLTCDVAFAVCSFDNQLFWNWTDFRHMMCVSIKHPINPSNGTCCDAMRSRTSSNIPSSSDIRLSPKVGLNAPSHGKWIRGQSLDSTLVAICDQCDVHVDCLHVHVDEWWELAGNIDNKVRFSISSGNVPWNHECAAAFADCHYI